MQITLDLVQIAGALVAVGAMLWALARMLLAQIERRLDERFAALSSAAASDRTATATRLDRLDEAVRHVERDIANVRAELPREYQRREDAIRAEATVMAKLDALSLKLDARLPVNQR